MIVFALAFAAFIERYNRCAMCESEAFFTFPPGSVVAAPASPPLSWSERWQCQVRARARCFVLTKI
jgi:hypothetical protein